MAGARAHAPEPPPACRPALDRLRMPRHPPESPLSLSSIPPLAPLSLAPLLPAERSRRPPQIAREATIDAALLHLFPELRKVPPFLYTESRITGGPALPPTRRLQPPDPTAPSGQFAASACRQLHRVAPLHRCELLFVLPLSPPSITSPSRCFCDGRELAAVAVKLAVASDPC